MKIASATQIESLRQLRFVIESLTVANSAVCTAYTHAEISGQRAITDVAAAVQSDLKIARTRFSDAYNSTAAELDADGVDYLHSAVFEAI